MSDRRLKTNPAVDMTDILPELPAEEYETLKASIGDTGVQVPIVMDQHHEIVDGKARHVRAMNSALPPTQPSQTMSRARPNGSSCGFNSTAIAAILLVNRGGRRSPPIS